MPPAVDPIESVFAAAVEIASDAERRKYVEWACVGDVQMKQRVEEMIDNHFRAGSFLKSPAPGLGTTSVSPVQVGPATVTGPYRLLGQGTSRPAIRPEDWPLPAIPGYEVEGVLGVGGMG